MALKAQNSPEPEAWIGDAPASVEDAAAAAAQLLNQSGQALIAGLGADVAGARVAIAIAERIGGVVDHVRSAALMRDLDCLRETGVMITTPGEARVRADLVLLVGDAFTETWPALNERLLRAPAKPDGAQVKRRIIWLAPNTEAKIDGFEGQIEIVAAGVGAALAANLAAVRAHVKGRRIAQSGLPPPALDALAAALKGARFGVAVSASARLEALELEMLNGLVRDLNETTRFSTLPLSPPDNAAGVLATCGWMMGFPVRTGFGSGAPAHDPWRFNAERLVASGETDCVLWIAAFGAPPPTWPATLSVIAVCDSTTHFATAPNVRISVGRPGVDYDAVLHSPETGTLIAVSASAPTSTLSLAQGLERIAERLSEASPPQC